MLLTNNPTSDKINNALPAVLESVLVITIISISFL